MDLSTFVKGIPKAELHLHIEGTLEPELKFRLAERNGLTLPYQSVNEVVAAYEFDSLSSFLVGYYEGMGVLIEEPDFYELGMAYFTRAASENVVYAEVFFDPQGHTSRGVPFAHVIEGLHRARLDAKSELDLDAQLIMCFLRDHSADSAMDTLKRAEPYRELIVGVGLDSDERENPPRKFAEVFGQARKQGYRLTMHCDVDQENTTEHIRQALHEIGVDRIDHGVNCLEDQTLTDEIRRRGIGLTVCPISNVYVTQDSRSSDIKKLLELGIRVTINSDDPAYFQGYITENLELVLREASLNRAEILQLIDNAFEICWAADDAKSVYRKQLDEYTAASSNDE